MLDSTPVKKALEIIAESSGRSGKFQIHSYEKHFHKLWGQHDGFESFIGKLQDEQVEELIVIWDNIPKGNTPSVDTTLYLTPVDWAVAFSLACVRTAKKSCNFRITIIDLNSDFSASAPSVRFIKQYPNRDIMSMPWVRIVRPIPSQSAKDDKAKNERDIKAVICDLLSSFDASKDFRSISQTFSADPSHDLGVVRSIWRANLVKTPNPDDHHAIANLLGPLLLSGDDAVKSSCANVCALRHMMKEMGLLPKAGNKPLGEPAQERLQKLTESLKSHKVKLLILDDQWQDGWGNAICSLLSAGYKSGLDKDKVKDQTKIEFVEISEGSDFVVKASSSPIWLLSENGNTKFDRDKRFKLRLDIKDDYQEIVCLDLRLFSGKDTQQEADFFKQLIEIAKRINKTANDTNKLSWPAIAQDELDYVTAWTENKDRTREDANYITALSLFPRILALTDLSLPIIIFSSTGRRDILEMLKPYGNIITIFDKPRLSADIPDDIAVLTKEKFIDALEAAQKFVIGRKAIGTIEKAAEKNKPEPLPAGDKYVEIFIDESGSVTNENNYFVIGGIVLIFENKAMADKLNNILENTTVDFNNGVSTVTHSLTWYGNKRLPKRLEYGVLSLKRNVADDEAILVENTILNRLHDVLSDNTIKAIPFTLRKKVRTAVDVNILSQEHLDNLYLKMITESLDTVIYELLPWHIQPGDSVEIKIVAGTRDRCKEDVTDNNGNKVRQAYTVDEQSSMSDDFGVIFSDNYRYKSINTTSLIPIVSSIALNRIDSLNRQDSCTKNIQITGAAGKELKYVNYDKGYVPRHAHYIADLVAHFEFISVPHFGHRDVFKKYYEHNRIIDESSEYYLLCSDASKYLDSHDIVSSIVSAFYSAKMFYENLYPESIVPKILYRVVDKLKVLSGIQYLEFVELVRTLTKSGAPKGKPSVSKSHRTAAKKATPTQTTKPVKPRPSNNPIHSHLPKTTSQPASINPSPQVPAKGNQSTTGSNEKAIAEEQITVVKITDKFKGKQLECSRSNGEICIVSVHQYMKLPKFDQRKIVLGCKLHADIDVTGNIVYARDIKLVAKSSDVKQFSEDDNIEQPVNEWGLKENTFVQAIDTQDTTQLKP